jgi:hypothetical protein
LSPAVSGQDFCEPCSNKELDGFEAGRLLVDRYPEQYRDTGDASEIDVFAVLQLFQVNDYSGCLQHAVRKILISSKPAYRDIREARDTLTRWMQLNQGTEV